MARFNIRGVNLPTCARVVLQGEWFTGRYGLQDVIALNWLLKVLSIMRVNLFYFFVMMRCLPEVNDIVSGC